MPDTTDKISKFIKDTAFKHGFTGCGIAKAEHLEYASPILRDWLDSGYHAGMRYMNRNLEKRLNPQVLNTWARSLIMVLYNYFPKDNSLSTGKNKISKYAYGKDYHDIIRDKLRKIVDDIEDEIGGIMSRVFVDSAPVLEKAWAQKCGLGWVGKNGCLINETKGSFFFIGTIITDMELKYDEAVYKDRCGSCEKCMDSCPNKAIIAPGVIDANKCISYLTIEHKGGFAEERKVMLDNWIFGCDTCQDVCPWNRFSRPHEEPEFLPSAELSGMKDADWLKLDKQTFDELFTGTAVKRTGYDALRRNIEKGTEE